SSRSGSEPPPSSPPSASPAPGLSSSCSSSKSEEEKAKKLLYCSLCKVAVNSLSQLEAHNTGSKHKTMLEARSGAGPIKAYPRPGAKLKTQSSGPKGSGLQNKTFHCQICDVHVNSEIQLKQHISSRRHKDRVAGKPSKPKYSPYNKQQRSSLTTKLALQKDLVKPSMSPSFLSSIALHPRPASSLFPPSFLRPAPGPIRATQGSILFAPY
uniref:zinc finger protein 385B-like n=1 Tax=Centroberyx gerrardi TaxID=166262 RepID=UPI003AAD8415